MLDLGDGATLTVLSADERGAVLLIEYGSFRALLPVGMSFDSLTELEFDKSLPPLTALLLADAGFAQLNSPEWISFLDPQLVMLSVSADNFNGLPDQETLEAVEGLTLLRTDVNGWIEISSDGLSIWVEVERPAPDAIPTATFTEDFLTPPPAPTEDPLQPKLPLPLACPKHPKTFRFDNKSI